MINLIMKCHFSFNSLIAEIGINRASRPRKRLGGGGYGHFKNINNSSSIKQIKRAKTFRQVGKRKQDNRQFSR